MNKSVFRILLTISIFAATVLPAQAVKLPNPLGSESLTCIVQNIVTAMRIVAVPLLTIMVFIGAFRILTAGGNEDKFSTGRKIITYAIIGFVIVLAAEGSSILIYNILSGGSADVPSYQCP